MPSSSAVSFRPLSRFATKRRSPASTKLPDANPHFDRKNPHAPVARAAHHGNMNTQTMVSSTPADPALWQAVLTRDRSAEGRFVYAVTSTRIYCRPTCPSRRPRPESVRFFATTSAAEAAGFRACFRCKPQNAAAPDAAWLNACREYLDRNMETRVSLADLAKFAGVSPTHLQRAFQRTFGLSPRAYQSAQRAQMLAEKLPSAGSVTTALYDSGYESPGPAYKAAARTLAMPPQRASKGAPGECIVYAVVPTALGKLLAAATARGLCRAAFADTSGSLTSELHNFRQAFHAAEILRATEAGSPKTHAAAAEILAAAIPALQHMAAGEHANAIPLDLRGTAFQQKVWQALRQIPRGKRISYSQLAVQMGQPTATRAVARACATNRVALAVPCHRVNASDGSLTGYYWGLERKRNLQAAESKPDTANSKQLRTKSPQ
jgi:AraC family transcriptional regulator of adaptative response/methylated-DNA-[protein]-cysteine methyltransferase